MAPTRGPTAAGRPQVFTVDMQTKERLVVKLDRVFPYLVVNVGSGISILKVLLLPWTGDRGLSEQWFCLGSDPPPQPS